MTNDLELMAMGVVPYPSEPPVGAKRCAACGKENPVSEMKICMHNQMHRYVCDMKCMDDFYNPPKKPAAQSLEAKVSALESERDTLRAQVEALRALLAESKRYVEKAWPDGVHSYRTNSISGDLLGSINAALQAKP